MTASPTPSGSASADAQAAWKTFTTPDGQFMFDYPPDWTVRDRAPEAAPGGIFVEVLSASGKSLAVLRTNIAPRDDCTTKGPYALMDSQDLPALAQGGAPPRFVFEGRASGAAGSSTPETLAYGITSSPLPTGPSACPIFQFFRWSPTAAAFGGVYKLPEVTPGTEGVESPEAYVATNEYELIRLTITSLRPAA